MYVHDRPPVRRRDNGIRPFQQDDRADLFRPARTASTLFAVLANSPGNSRSNSPMCGVSTAGSLQKAPQRLGLALEHRYRIGVQHQRPVRLRQCLDIRARLVVDASGRPDHHCICRFRQRHQLMLVFETRRQRRPSPPQPPPSTPLADTAESPAPLQLATRPEPQVVQHLCSQWAP